MKIVQKFGTKIYIDLIQNKKFEEKQNNDITQI